MVRDLYLRRSRATTVFLIAAGILLAYLCYQIARPFLTALAWATILAVVFAPLHHRARLAFRNTNLSALFSTGVTLLIGVLPIVLLVTAISREAAVGYRQLREHLASGNTVTGTAGIGPVIQRVNDALQEWDVDVGALGGQATSYLGDIVLTLAKGTISNLSAFLLNVVLVGFTLFFFFRDGPKILEHLERIVPVELSEEGGIFELIGQVIRAAIFGVVVMSLLKGILAGLAFWVLGLHSPALWGAAGAIASVVPVVGISLVWVPAAIVLWAQGMTLKALLMVIWGATVLSLIDNVLYPILVRSRVRLHTLVVFISTLGGLSVFGFLGFVLGPVVATLALTLVDVASHSYAPTREEPPS
ncbi:MAG: AI-2E family transporter [Acidobacteriota bacterium]